MTTRNTMYNENGIAAQKFMDETERLANAQYCENGRSAKQYMEETGRAAAIIYHG